MGTLLRIALAFVLISALTPEPARAQFTGLSYPERTRTYSGWTSIVKGDNNTIGMAGATVALPNSIAAMENNPAGFAMNLGGLAAQINSFSVKDPELNRSTQNFTEYQWGVGTSTPPWGFGITYYSPSSEHVADSEVSVRQLRLSAARLIGRRLSIGVVFQFNKGIRRFDEDDFSSTHFSYQVGVLYKLEDHVVLGASFTPAFDIAPTDDTGGVPTFGFNQTIRVPSITSFGFGWMPNRFFKAGTSLLLVSGTPGSALLYDQTIGYGERFTLQPRLGASYILAEYNFLKVELAMGTYYEVSRTDGVANRLHGTFGLDINPWFVNTGVGTDIATRYRNWSVSLGVDIVRTLRTFEIIPKDTVSPYRGTFPPMFKVSANGMADGFTQGEKKTESPASVSQVKDIVQDIPKRMQEKFGFPKTEEAKPLKKKRKKHRSLPASPKKTLPDVEASPTP